jgi:hypothetical protein
VTGRSSKRSWFAYGAAGLACIGLVVTLAPGCIFAFTQNSLGQGNGCVSGVLNIPNCWAGNFNLDPDFFVGVPYQTSLEIRIQRGSDFETFSDGLEILIDNVDAIRPGGDAGPDGAGLYGDPLPVAIPVGVTAPGVPLVANPNPALVHVSLYLQNSCQTQNVSPFALQQVSLSPDGSCNGVAANASSFVCGPLAPDSSFDVGVPESGGPEGGAEAGAPPPPPAPIGYSTMTFTSLFDDNPDESNAAERLTEATFDLYFADPRTAAPGGLGPPPMCQGHIQGSFRFYFQRGQPGQPFP